ncbi:hypothetical protein [Streptomyces sp. NPDC058542]|uniref:WXG100 family type VII secretion target n=1 Tax=Streptomyces sp. NPDC058542 TaxID=3346543 RepID=UPI0036539AB3
MSDEKQQDLTPAEQSKQDEGRVQTQIVVTDMTETAGRVMESFGFGNPRAGGRTSFEGHQLNALIDMVENSNPEHLESAGEALWKARDAIRRAAKELKDHLKGVDWQGESGTAFRAFGTGLVAHAEKLGDFADSAGTQITVAGTGLASVKSAMPPRDRRMIQTDVKDILFPARTETNPQYAAALEVEKNRQEAINQINRLASYYSVSEEVLAGQEPPRFDSKLDVGMPKPENRRLQTGDEASGEGATTLGSRGVPDSSVRAATGGGGLGPAEGRRPIEVLGSGPVLDDAVSTEINSVKAPPAPTTVTSTPPLPSPTPTTGPTGAPPSPVPPPLMNTTQRSSPRTAGPSMPRTVTQTGLGMGKAQQPTVGGPVAKGPGGPPTGRPSAMGGGGSPTGRPPVGPQSPITGRSTPTSGRPITGQGGTSTGGAPRAGGRNGIVGGTPQNASQGRAAAGASGQRGVIGGRGAAAATSRPGGRPAQTSGANGVVGAPRKAAGGGSNAKGFTAGGAGLVRGPAGRRNSGREDEEGNGSNRPDYLTEDEETWNAGRRGAVPPVVE